MTEREKMLSGALYWAGAPELVQARRRAKELCSRFNQEAVQDPEAGARLLRELLGEAGDDISIQPMFWCDYGCNIRMGSQIEINHNCVILDCAPVAFGDHVFIGPNCGFYTAGHPLDAAPWTPPPGTLGWSLPGPSPWGTTSGSAAMWPSCPGSPSAPARSSARGAWSAGTSRPMWWRLAVPAGCCAPSIPAARRSRNHLLDASQRERRTMPVRRNRHRNVHQKRQSLPGGQDDEEKGASRGRRPSRGLKIRRMPFRTTRVRTQSANMRGTAKQRGCDRETRVQMSASLSSQS